jgi:hypothetical protein
MPISMNNTTLTFNNGTTMTTAATGTVSSVATGNGLTGGTITSTGTLSIAPAAYQSIGSYMGLTSNVRPVNVNNNYSGANCNVYNVGECGTVLVGAATGTYRCLGALGWPSWLGVRVA